MDTLVLVSSADLAAILNVANFIVDDVSELRAEGEISAETHDRAQAAFDRLAQSLTTIHGDDHWIDPEPEEPAA